MDDEYFEQEFEDNPRIYLAGGLFNAGQRFHNLFLERYLSELGHKVILPQREALKFKLAKGKKFDLAGIVNSCQENCLDRNNIYVGCIDGADADSGTCVEYGMAIAATGRAVVYRTDFRTAPDNEVGVNAMLKAQNTVYIYYPCLITELDQIDHYYENLAVKISDAIGLFY